MYALAVFGYCVVVVLANYFTDTFIPLPFAGLLSVGTLFFGATFTLRDYVHHYGRKRVYLMIGIAAVVNVIAAWLLGTPARFIIASFITIIIAEAADTEVYQAMIKRPWLARVAVSNSVSVPLDSILFTLEIGCGTGRNLIAIARRYPGVRLYGLDASAQMLKTAQLQLARAGLDKQVILVQGLAEDITPQLFGQTEFDHALFSYSLSMIPGWREALIAAAKALSANGSIHIVDFGDLKTMPGRSLLRLWLGLFHVSPRGALLEALEGEINEQSEGLNILPGRYAFRLNLTKGNLGTFSCVSAVTGGG